jgi:DNA-binding transcriptional regulator YiaG
MDVVTFGAQSKQLRVALGLSKAEYTDILGYGADELKAW